MSVPSRDSSQSLFEASLSKYRGSEDRGPNYVRFKMTDRPAERWPSGLRRTLGKRVYFNEYRGFESHSLRHRLYIVKPLHGDFEPIALFRSSSRIFSFERDQRAFSKGKAGCFFLRILRLRKGSPFRWKLARFCFFNYSELSATRLFVGTELFQ